MDKQVSREVYRRIRLAMSRAEVKTKSRLICRKVIAEANWQEVRNACIYAPIEKLNETDISSLGTMMKRHGLRVHRLTAGKDAEIPVEKFDLILVPCLAFDENNYRLGWGGGFYDRFLAGQPQALKIGLCFQNGFSAEDLPREPHDIPLDKVITEV